MTEAHQLLARDWVHPVDMLFHLLIPLSFSGLVPPTPPFLPTSNQPKTFSLQAKTHHPST
ncbi:hypothetical protein GQ44DRAFT_707225 [Phaeosphaeriaceae sp. PMI808]|nr:hypothetical protein GQ44DRAFT_707225 [Phaeosphaeriaceae sp. PMI808]